MLQGMSDLCMYELEDIAWDELCQSEDHIVPHPGSNSSDDPSVLGESCQNPRFKGNTTSICAGDQSVLACAGQRKEQGKVSTLSCPRNMILGQDSWSSTPKSGFPTSSDSNSVKEVSSIVSENSSLSGFKNNNADSIGSEKCENDTILNDKIAVVDNNSFSYPLDDITQTSKDIDFFENTEEKDPSDFLYYGWPEIENFEDVDRMFSCDSTFGVGSSKEDELRWLSLADDIGVPGDMPKSDFKFPSPESIAVEEISKNSYSLNRYSHEDSAMASSSERLKESSMPTEKSDSYMSSVNEFAVTDNKDGLISKERGTGIKGKIQSKNSAGSHAKPGIGGMIKEHKKQSKLPLAIQLEGKRKKHYFGNGSFDYVSDRSNSGAMTHPLFPSVYNQQQHQTVGPDFCNYLQNTPFVHSDSSHLSDKTSVEPTPFSIKSEMDLTYPSPRESVHASNQLQTLEGFHPPFHKSATDGDETKERLHNFQGLGPSNVHESSSRSSGLDDISLEAAILRQLQLVMEQLDLRTKLCIRDSLYRLAWSAEQRHDLTNQNGGCGDGRDASGTSMTDGTKCAGFMGMETDTNPLDRSIAHLLFHRPSDTSAVPALDSSPFKLPTMVHGSITCQPVMVDNLVVQEEISAKTENQGFEC
ncbi:protein LNK1-like isoform X2 [Henckelia pumila]|uniref:protein LNK1-like isoform X2 n=1 Tax=Henckelia pumila TaxID=405737 RepID=UPI003C6E9CDF